MKVESSTSPSNCTRPQTALFLQAYRAWVQRNGEEPRLPGVNLTHNQLFFLKYAQVCYNQVKIFISVISVTQSKSLSLFLRQRALINITLENNKSLLGERYDGESLANTTGASMAVAVDIELLI